MFSLRMRLALVAGVALAVVLLAASIAAVAWQRAELTRGTARLAEQQARSVARAVSNADDLDVAGSGAGLPGYVGRESTVVEVVGTDGRVLATSGGLDRTAPLLPAPRAGAPAYRVLTGIATGETDRYVAALASVPGGGRYVVAATSLESVDAATASTTRLLALGAPVIVLLVAGLGYWLAGRALRPVEAMRRRATEIGATDLAARLPVGDAGDEIARLGETLNGLLARLQAGQDVQRRFVADASHELRSPIASVRTLLEVASADADTDWPTVAAVALVENHRLERLADDLLQLARATDMPMAADARFDLADLLRDEACRARRLPVDVDVRGALLVAGVPDAITLAVRNVVDNAERHAVRRIALTARVEGHDAVVHVRDDGPGVAPRDRARVLERFVRLDESRSRDAGGAGLGLAIALEHVTRHGGTLAFVGAGPGADLRISLPLVGEADESTGCPTIG